MMRVGLIGLGRVGEGMSRQMIQAGHEVWGYRKDTEAANEQYEKGYISGYATSIETLVQVVKKKECIYGEKSGETIITEQSGVFQMVIPEERVEDTLDELIPLLREGDIIIDYSNNDTTKCQELEKYCSKLGISYIFSGVYGATHAINACSKIFQSLSPGNAK